MQNPEAKTRPRAKLPENCTIDLATVSDVVQLTYVFKDFFGESDYARHGITFSPNRAAVWLKRGIEAGVFPHIVARIGEQIVGVISWSMDDSFCEEPIAVLHTIYVKPKFRRSIIGRTLVALAMDIARSEGACAFSAPITSGMKEMRGLQNMLAKAGFAPSGVVMTKRF